MGRRGRPAILKDRKTTTVSIEGDQFQFALDQNIDLSKLLRDTLEVLRKNKEVPIEKMKRERDEKLEQIKELDIDVKRLDKLIKDAEETQAMMVEQGRLIDELDEKRRSYLLNYKDKVSRHQKCSRIWLEYLTEGLGFATFEEAKVYARKVWINDGMEESTVNSFLRLN